MQLIHILAIAVLVSTAASLTPVADIDAHQLERKSKPGEPGPALTLPAKSCGQIRFETGHPDEIHDTTQHILSDAKCYNARKFFGEYHIRDGCMCRFFEKTDCESDSTEALKGETSGIVASHSSYWCNTTRNDLPNAAVTTAGHTTPAVLIAASILRMFVFALI